MIIFILMRHSFTLFKVRNIIVSFFLISHILVRLFLHYNLKFMNIFIYLLKIYIILPNKKKLLKFLECNS